MGVRTRSSVSGGSAGATPFDVTSAAKSLSVPAGEAAYVAEIYVRGNSVVFSRDGIAPTTTRGIQADAGDIIVLNSRDEVRKFQVIRETSGNAATLDVEYFTDVSG
jgi:hypothetical protein